MPCAFRAAAAADVNVTLEVWPHMIHASPMWNARLADGRRRWSTQVSYAAVGGIATSADRSNL